MQTQIEGDGHMERTGPLREDPTGRTEITCTQHGYTIDGEEVWWIEETRELFVYKWDEFRPYVGPVVHGTGYTF